jgi:hypothetical protein
VIVLCSRDTAILYGVCRSIDGRCEEERCVVVLCSMRVWRPRGFVGRSCGRRGEERVVDIIENRATLQSRIS